MRRILGFLEYLVIFLIIMDTNTVYSAAFNVDYHIPEITAGLLFIYLFLRFIVTRPKKSMIQKYAKFISFYYVITLFLIAVIVKGNMVLSYVARFLCVFPMLILFFVEHAERKQLFDPLHKYANLMAAFAGISLFFWIFGTQLHWVRPTGTIQALWMRGSNGIGTPYIYPSYFGLYVERQRETFLGYTILRNQGIFAEAPMYSLCLVLAIAVELFLPKQVRKQKIELFISGKSIFINWKLLFLVLALLSTVTTTGQILLIFMIVLRFFMEKPHFQFNLMLKYLFCAVAAVIGLLVAIQIFDMKSSSGSWAIRADDFRSGFLAWLSSPIWGNGYGDKTVVDAYKASFRVTGQYGGFSNSIMQVLYQGGILLFFIYILPLCRSVKNSLAQRDFQVLALVIVFLLEFVYTVFSYKFIMFFFLAFFYMLGYFTPMTNLQKEVRLNET